MMLSLFVYLLLWAAVENKEASNTVMPSSLWTRCVVVSDTCVRFYQHQRRSVLCPSSPLPHSSASPPCLFPISTLNPLSFFSVCLLPFARSPLTPISHFHPTLSSPSRSFPLPLMRSLCPTHMILSLFFALRCSWAPSLYARPCCHLLFPLTIHHYALSLPLSLPHPCHPYTPPTPPPPFLSPFRLIR